EVYEAITDSCKVYLNASSGQRQRIRELFRRSNRLPHYIWAATGELITNFKHSGDPEWIDLALAAIAIEDQHLDTKDTFVTLGLLYVEVFRRGLAPNDYLEHAAKMASPEMRAFLEGFETSPYFKSEV